ncbi:hypothetical protein EDD11_010408 [Mortierella claussenii]|nr:hypothetical protein EDD11_010408 [Mortierella claussenii]
MGQGRGENFNQLARTSGDMEGHSVAGSQRSHSSDPFRQFFSSGLRRQFRWNEVHTFDGPGQADLVILPFNKDPDNDGVHQVGGQSSRSPLSRAEFTDRVEPGALNISGDRGSVGTTLDRPVCIQEESSSSEVCLMETGSDGSDSGRDVFPVDKGKRVCVSPLGSDFQDLGQDSSGTIDDLTSDTRLAVGDLVSNSSGSGTGGASSSATSGKQRPYSRRASYVDSASSMASDRQWLEKEGASESTIKRFQSSALTRSKHRNYASIQHRWSEWCSTKDISSTSPSPLDVVNYLVDGMDNRSWSSSTVRHYCSAILSAVPSGSRFWENEAFRQFFVHMDSNEIKNMVHSPVDISPVLNHFKTLGPNLSLELPMLTHKLCWLLAVCGFLRPSDIQRIHLSSSLMTDSMDLKLHIIDPKERRGGKKVIKSTFIRSHEDVLICPVNAFAEYSKISLLAKISPKAR